MPPAPPTPPNERSLLTIVIDISTATWGERDVKRKASDRARLAQKKASIGPATLNDVISSLLAFCLAFACLNRENCVVVVGVAGDECAVIYPRKGGDRSMENMVNDPCEMGEKIDARRLHDCVMTGVAELMKRDEAKVRRAIDEAGEGDGSGGASSEGTTTKTKTTTTAAAAATPSTTKPIDKGAAIATGLSLALCTTNRFMVYSTRTNNAASLKTNQDQGIIALLESGNNNNNNNATTTATERRLARGMLSPRILIVQCTDDRTRDYNAFMNGTFAAIKNSIVIDGCFVASGIAGQPTSSSFLEQASDRTGGVYLGCPAGPGQVGGALTEIMCSVFLAPMSTRGRLNLPALTVVDFRARCFETGESVDLAYVCNQCLSIFKNRPKVSCSTCGAVPMKTKGKMKGGGGGDGRLVKRLKYG